MQANVPTFDVALISSQIESFYSSHSYLETLYAILGAIDRLIPRIPSELGGVSEQDEEAWRQSLGAFSDRFRWYVEASEAGEGPEEVEALVSPPLFEGDYDEAEFESMPGWPDVETPWRLLNRLARSGSEAAASMSTETDFEEILEAFWNDIAGNLTDELAGGEDVDVEAEKAIDEAKKNSTVFLPEAVSMVDPSAPLDDDDEGSSMAPLLLGIGAIFLMANKRRR